MAIIPSSNQAMRNAQSTSIQKNIQKIAKCFTSNPCISRGFSIAILDFWRRTDTLLYRVFMVKLHPESHGHGRPVVVPGYLGFLDSRGQFIHCGIIIWYIYIHIHIYTWYMCRKIYLQSIIIHMMIQSGVLVHICTIMYIIYIYIHLHLPRCAKIQTPMRKTPLPHEGQKNMSRGLIRSWSEFHAIYCWSVTSRGNMGQAAKQQKWTTSFHLNFFAWDTLKVNHFIWISLPGTPHKSTNSYEILYWSFLGCGGQIY